MITVYGVFLDGLCLYVGRTQCLAARRPCHERRFSRLLGRIPKVKALRYVHPDKAGRAERTAIKRFQAKGEAAYNTKPGLDKKETPNLRNLSFYKQDYDFLCQVADAYDKTPRRMFRYMVAQLKEGKALKLSVNMNGGQE